MTNTELAEKAWTNLCSSEEFKSSFPENAITVFEPLVRAIPDVLGDDILSSRATFENIAKSKIVFLKYAIEEGFVGKLMTAMGMDSFMANMLKANMEDVIEMLEPLIESAAAFLEEQGVSEEYVLVQFGLDKAGIEKHRNGMTIAELFADYPLVIIKNT